MSVRELPARPNLEQYKKQAKDLLEASKAGAPEALARMRKLRRSSARLTLAGAQFVIAREHGFDSWLKFAKQITTLTGGDSHAAVWKTAEDAVVVGDVETLERLLRALELLLLKMPERFLVELELLLLGGSVRIEGHRSSPPRY